MEEIKKRWCTDCKTETMHRLDVIGEPYYWLCLICDHSHCYTKKGAFHGLKKRVVSGVYKREGIDDYNN